MKDEALRLALEALEANLANWNAKRKAIPIIKQALEQSVATSDTSQEPVAKIEKMQHERKWVGLTDVDVSKILDEQNGFYTFEKCFNFAKAIESKLKEKNNE